MSAEERLEALGIELPEPPKPVANYVTNMIVDRCLYVSGHGPAPLEGAKLTGKVDLATLIGAMGYVLVAVGVLLIWRGVTV